MKSNIQTFIAAEAAFDDARAVLFGAPFDGTTSFRPGTRFGPQAIRAESDGIETYSPYQNKDLEDIAVFDSGDLLLPFGNTEAVLAMIEARTQEILDAGKMPVMLGGEHLVTLGAVRAMVKKYPDLHIIHFDAHADLRDDYLGECLSHATVLRRSWDLLGDGRIHQFGIRSGERSEFEFALEHTDFHPFNVKDVLDVVLALGDKVPVYVTLDLDVLDPSLFCGTGTPEAGGIFFQDLEEALLALEALNVVGFDMNELSPHYDASGVSTAVACKVLREMLLAYVK
ncbi:MAG: agmatinase [Peptococcaceae bacterium]|nr:agmatinase [Peptococcaceae bacterium]